jgi:hypothetical protein
LLFSGGYDTNKSITYNLGVSLTKPIDERFFRIDLSIKGASFKNGVEAKAGVEGNNVFAYLYAQNLGEKKLRGGMGIAYGFSLPNKDVIEICVQRDFVTDNVSFLFNVISPF